MPDALLPTASEFELYLEGIRRLVREKLIPAEPRLDGQETLPEDLTQLLRDAGLFGISIPTAHGGLGLTMEQQVRVMFEVTRASSVFRARFSTTIGLGSQPILYNGTDEQRAEWLPRMASGEVTASFALTEPEAGSDAAGCAPRHSATAVISSSTAPSATSPMRCRPTSSSPWPAPRRAAATPPASPPSSSPPRTPGLTVSPPDRKMGQDGSPTSEVYFDQVRVPETALVGGREGGGFKTAMRGINHARLHVAVTCVGQAQRLLEEALAYTTQRKQFGQALAESSWCKPSWPTAGRHPGRPQHDFGDRPRL